MLLPFSLQGSRHRGGTVTLGACALLPPRKRCRRQSRQLHYRIDVLAVPDVQRFGWVGQGLFRRPEPRNRTLGIRQIWRSASAISDPTVNSLKRIERHNEWSPTNKQEFATVSFLDRFFGRTITERNGSRKITATGTLWLAERRGRIGELPIGSTLPEGNARSSI